MIVRCFTLREFLVLTSTINSRFMREGVRLQASVPFLFCRPFFSSLGRRVSVELLVDPSLSNANLHVHKVPSFVGREMLNLLNTESRGADVPRQSNTKDLDTGFGFPSSSTSKVMCCDVTFFSFPLAEIRTGSCDEYPNPVLGISIA